MADLTQSVAETKKPGKRGPKPGLPQRGGIPEGYKFPQTLQREDGRRLLQQKAFARLEPIVDAVINKAIGINHFMLRNPADGQWLRVDDPIQIAAALNHPNAAAGSTYLIHVKDPDIAAAKDILDRTLGKPVEEVQVDGNITLEVQWQK